MTNQDAMKVKTFLERMMDRKAQIAGMFQEQENDVDIAVSYGYSFEQTAIEALDLLGEIEWPDEQKTEDWQMKQIWSRTIIVGVVSVVAAVWMATFIGGKFNNQDWGVVATLLILLFSGQAIGPGLYVFHQWQKDRSDYP